MVASLTTLLAQGMELERLGSFSGRIGAYGRPSRRRPTSARQAELPAYATRGSTRDDEPLSSQPLRQVVADARRVRADEVSLHATHVSLVFVAGDRALKFEKPLTWGSLTTALMSVVARCAGELLLNRRLAPDIYCRLISVVANDDDELALVTATIQGRQSAVSR